MTLQYIDRKLQVQSLLYTGWLVHVLQPQTKQCHFTEHYQYTTPVCFLNSVQGASKNTPHLKGSSSVTPR